jgi:hypothetical protein
VAQLSLPAIPLPQRLKEIVSVVGVQLILRAHETEGIQYGSCIYAVFKDWHIRFLVGTSLENGLLDSRLNGLGIVCASGACCTSEMGGGREGA